MPTHVKVDEDLPRGVADLLRESGYEAATVHEQGMTGATDATVWSTVQAESRLLVTADKGFADVRLHPPGTHHGVILLRLHHESRRGYIDLTRRLLDTKDLQSLVGAISVVSPERIRVRRS